MDVFIDADGQFNGAAFVLFTVVRFWMWGVMLRLVCNSCLASQALCNWIEHMDMTKLTASEPHVPHTLESLRQR